jgi:hypothetical protein
MPIASAQMRLAAVTEAQLLASPTGQRRAVASVSQSFATVERFGVSFTIKR